MASFSFIVDGELFNYSFGEVKAAHDAFGPVAHVNSGGHAMPHVRFGQRWSLPDGLEVAVLDVVTPRFIGRREDGVRVTGECSELRKHGKLVVDVPQRSEREMVANTVYREAEFPPEGMAKRAWLAHMVNETEVSATHRATRAGFCRFVSQGNGFASWNGALELTWPAPVVAPVEPVKAEPVVERPVVRPRRPSKPVLSRKVEVGQVWQHESENTNVTVAQVEENCALMSNGWAIAIRNGEPASPCWVRIS